MAFILDYLQRLDLRDVNRSKYCYFQVIDIINTDALDIGDGKSSYDKNATLRISQ